MHESAQQQKKYQADRHRVPGGGAAVEVELKTAQHRGHHHTLQAIRTARQPIELVGQLQQDQRHAQGHHKAGQVRAAHDGQAAHSAQYGRHGRRDQQADEWIGHHQLGKQRGGICAGAKEGGMPERDDAGVTQHQIERDCKQRHDRDFADQQRMAGHYQRRQQRQQPEHWLPGLPATGGE